MGFSTHNTTSTPLRPFYPSSFAVSRPCPRPVRVALSSFSVWAPSQARHRRRRILLVQTAPNGHQNSTLSSNSLRCREGSHFLSTVVGMSKYNVMEYNRTLPYKSPVCVSFMKFSTASTGMLEETTDEEELTSHYGEAEALIGDRNGWARARDSLTETKKEIKFVSDRLTETKKGSKFVRSNRSAYASKIIVPNGQKQALPEKGEQNLLVQDHGEPVSPAVIHAQSRNTKALKDSESVSSLSIEALLTENKKGSKFVRSNRSAYASKIIVPNDQKQALPKKGEQNLLVQDHGEPVSPPVIHAQSRNTKALKDSESVSSLSIEAPLQIKKEAEVNDNHSLDASAKSPTTATFAREHITGDPKLRTRLCSIYKDILVVNNISLAKRVVGLLTNKYRHLIHACDTEVAEIDVKVETPVDHGEIICFSIYSGPDADFGNGKSCIWVDVLDGGGEEILFEFEPFFKDQSIKKVWHNYSFDNHVIENYGLKVSGFHADTMHMARLWNSSRRLDGGYSLEALTSDKRVMSGAQLNDEKDLVGKVSMKTIFGRKKLKKDGSEGKIITIAPVEELQRDERIPWICYSALDARSTLNLYESLKSHLSKMPWKVDGVDVMGPVSGKSMYDFYEEYWRPFGELLVKMETEGMLVDRAYLAEIEKVAKAQQEKAVNRFRKWASRYCPDAKYMNVGSDAQLRQLLFGGTVNSKYSDEALPNERTFKIPNVDNVIKEGKKTPAKYRDIKLQSLGVQLQTDMYTETGWPSVSGNALKALAGNASAEYDFFDEVYDLDLVEDDKPSQSEVAPVKIDNTTYGTAFSAFSSEDEGREACHAIASLCEVCSIDSLISNFILPLQGSNIAGRNGRIHCSLNINTETGRLSARRPNLQNQPALEKDRYKIRQAFIASPGNSLIVADYGQLELRILAHLASCKSMLDAFKAGGDFHSRTAMNMYPYIREAVEEKQVLLEWHPQPGQEKPPVPLLKDAFGSERRKAKMLNFSIAYGKTPVGLARDWKVSVREAKKTVELWYNDRKEVLAWQEQRKKEACKDHCVYTLLGRARRFPLMARATSSQKNHIERAAINTPVQGSAADVAMCAMLEISRNTRLKELGWKLLLQVHDEVILEGPTESAEVAKAIVVDCMSKPFNGKNFLQVDLSVDAKCAQNWYSAK